MTAQWIGILISAASALILQQFLNFLKIYNIFFRANSKRNYQIRMNNIILKICIINKIR